MTRTHLEEQILELAEEHQPPKEEFVEQRLSKIKRMENFYESKVPVAPRPQNLLFKSFVRALSFVNKTVKSYCTLTKALQELAKEIEDETRTDSES